MGHSRGSGASRVGLPRGVLPNSRFGRAWKEAADGEAIEVLREYDTEIKKARERRDSSSNGFKKQVAQQEIDRLREERRRISERFLD